MPLLERSDLKHGLALGIPASKFPGGREHHPRSETTGKSQTTRQDLCQQHLCTAAAVGASKGRWTREVQSSAASLMRDLIPTACQLGTCMGSWIVKSSLAADEEGVDS